MSEVRILGGANGMVKIKLPKKIKIGTMICEIKYTPNLRNDNAWRACFNQRTAMLEIDPACGATQDRSFEHEVVHLIDINYECGLSEENISRLANGLDEFLKDYLGIEFDWSDIK